jgi:hypothetical protein
MVLNLKHTTDAGVTRAIKTGASPLEINDGEYNGAKVPLASEPVSSFARRSNGRVNYIAGILKPKIDRNFSTAYRN